MEKIIDIEDRIPTLKARRKRRTNTKFFMLFSLFFIILLFLLYFQSSYSNVKTLEVSGATLADKTYYSEKSTISIGKSMWSFREEEIEGILKQDDWVKDVTVKRNWLTGVEIIIEEWPKVAYIQKDGEFYPMLENGVVYPVVNNRALDAPIFLDFEDVNLRKRLVKELAKLHPEVLALISHVNAFPSESDPYAIRLYMNDGNEVRAVISTLSSKLNYYPQIIKVAGDQKGIINLEVGSFYRSYDKEYGDGDLDLALEEENMDIDVVGQEVDEDGQTTSE